MDEKLEGLLFSSKKKNKNNINIPTSFKKDNFSLNDNKECLNLQRNLQPEKEKQNFNFSFLEKKFSLPNKKIFNNNCISNSKINNILINKKKENIFNSNFLVVPKFNLMYNKKNISVMNNPKTKISDLMLKKRSFEESKQTRKSSINSPNKNFEKIQKYEQNKILNKVKNDNFDQETDLISPEKIPTLKLDIPTPSAFKKVKSSYDPTFSPNQSQKNSLENFSTCFNKPLTNENRKVSFKTVLSDHKLDLHNILNELHKFSERVDLNESDKRELQNIIFKYSFSSCSNLKGSSFVFNNNNNIQVN